jgi:hypothetical protein
VPDSEYPSQERPIHRKSFRRNIVLSLIIVDHCGGCQTNVRGATRGHHDPLTVLVVWGGGGGAKNFSADATKTTNHHGEVVLVSRHYIIHHRIQNDDWLDRYIGDGVFDIDAQQHFFPVPIKTPIVHWHYPGG